MPCFVSCASPGKADGMLTGFLMELVEVMHNRGAVAWMSLSHAGVMLARAPVHIHIMIVK